MSHSTIRQYFLVALLVAVGVTAFWILQPFLMPLALAAIFAVVLQPVHRRALHRLRGSRALASVVTLIAFLIVILVPLTFFGEQLLRESEQLYVSMGNGAWRTAIDAAVQTHGPWLDAYVPGSAAHLATWSASINDYAQQALTWLIQHLGVAFSGVSAFVLSLFIFILSLYYLLADGAALCRYLVRLSPLADTDDEMILHSLSVSVNSVVRGRLLIALAQGVFAGIGFAIFGVPNAVFWSLIGSAASLVPPLGTGLVVLPAVAYVFLTGHTGAAIGLLLWGFVASIIDNVFGPQLMSKGTEQHPLITMLAILGGIAYFGPVGVFLGPLTLSLLQTLLSLHIHSSRAV